MRDIPLEYFARALRRLRARPDVDLRRVAVIGVSRGGEAALLIGATYPRLVHGVVALVPSNVVNPTLDGHSAAWTVHGRPVPHVSGAELGDPDPVSAPDALRSPTCPRRRWRSSAARRPAHEAAKAALWPRIVAFMGRLGG